MQNGHNKRKSKQPPAVRPATTLSFRDFFLIWATQVHNWKVPQLHLTLVNFLEKEQWSNDTAVIQIFRGAGKSTILALYIAWKLTVDPTLRFMIVSANLGQAKRISKATRDIIRRHPFATWLLPNDVEKSWTSTEFSVAYSTDASTPSVDARGAQSSITGSRADIILYDDIEVPKNVKTESLREQIRDRVAEGAHVLVPGGKTIFLGTPHTVESLYLEVITKGASALTIPLLQNITGEFPKLTGDSAWPERFTPAEIIKKQVASKSRNNFFAQYQLQPSLSNDSLLDASKILVYSDEVTISTFRGKANLRLGMTELISVSAWWDVSTGQETKGDASVLAIVFMDSRGHYYVHRTVALLGEIEEQCKQVVKLVKEFCLPKVQVETNGLGTFVPRILMTHLQGTGCAVDGVHSQKNKEDKIVEAFEIPLSARIIYAHESVMKSPFKMQLLQFSPRKKLDHDDFIDATASAIEREPIRINASTFKVQQHGLMKTWGNVAAMADIEVEVDRPF